ARGSVRDGQAAGVRADRLEAGARPLRCDRDRLIAAAELNDAAGDPQRAPELLQGDPQHRLEIELGANLAGDRRQQPLPLERLLERRGRLGALERLRRERPQRAELPGRERPALAGGRDREHADHPLAGDERDEGRALRADRLGNRVLDQRRVGRVVDRDRRDLERRARDHGGLAAKVETEVAPAVEVLAVTAGEQPARLAQLVVDEGETGELDAEEGRDLVEQHARDGLGVSRPGDRPGDRLDRLELAFPERRTLGCLAGLPHANGDERTVAEPEGEQRRRDRGDDDRSQRQPRVPADRAAVDEHLGPEQRRRDADARQQQRLRPVEQRRTVAAPQEPRRDRRAHAEIERRERDQRYSVEPDGLAFVGHWALLIIGPGTYATGGSWLEKIGRSAYWR